MKSLERAELDEVLDATRPHWDQLRNARVVLTGATGFFGLWLLESFVHINQRLNLGAHIDIVARRPEVLRERAPHLANQSCITPHAADIRSFTGPRATHVIHAATSASAALNEASPMEMATTILEGTQRALAIPTERFLFVSSGAVYGKQRVDHVAEDEGSGPDPLSPRNAYAESKRMAELFCALSNVPVVVARAFAFVGPWLPLDEHFAIGNFIRDGLHGRPIVVSGDGTAVRSYLYSSDLAAWLWTLLFAGTPGRAYNVGSEDAHNVRDVASRVGAHFGVPVTIMKQPEQGRPVDRYVPSTTRARQELGLAQTIALDEAIARTARWHR
jgi:nucleoside-diphosphate-sugar epimerase